MLEIYRFVPAELLKGIELEKSSIDEFLYYLAIARASEEMESNIHAKALTDIFGE